MNTFKEGDMVVYGTEGLYQVQEIADMKFGARVTDIMSSGAEGQ